VNSELRHVYMRTGSDLSIFGSRNNPSLARNLRLLVVLWEEKNMEELSCFLASKVGGLTPMSTGDCVICTEHLSSADMTAVEGCGHVMCKGCLREHIGARLGERVWPILCPICMAERGSGRSVQRTPLIIPKERLGWVLTIPIAITRFLVDELGLPQLMLNQWTEFELSQFVVPATCPKCVLPSSVSPSTLSNSFNLSMV
jgi:Ring finger domain